MTEPPLAAQPSLGHPFGGATAELRFVGRKPQLSALIEALPPGFAAIRLVTGDAGIGKSRLVAEAVAEAQKRGHTVVWGPSPSTEGAPSFWPWIQIARTLLRTAEGTDLEALLLDDPTATRLDLFNAVAELLQSSQESAPLVVVLEDLHAADSPSLALLEFLVRQRQSPRILFLGTYRRREARDPAVGEQLRNLSTPDVSINLEGLSAKELRSLIPEDGPDAREFHAITGGNPLFAEQVLRLWVAKGELRAERGFVGVTANSTLRSVTKSRLEQLPAAARYALSAIAVHGRPLAVRDVAMLLGEAPHEVDARLAPSIAAGVLIMNHTTRDNSEVSFAHVLLANAAVELSPPESLSSLHRRCAEILEGRKGRGAERAHHLLQSGARHAQEALSACEQAGDEALAALAFEDAIAHYRQALRVIDVFGAGDAHRRLLVVIELGIAQWATGDYSDADVAFDAAWHDAVRLGDANGQALAALGPGFRFEFTGARALERAERCTTALNAISDSPSALRARLLATLSAAQLVLADQSASRQAAHKAFTIATELGDDLATAYALIATIITDLDPETLDDRLTGARKVLAIARSHGDRELAASGYFLLLAALLEAGDIRAIDAKLEPRRGNLAAATELQDSRHASWFRCSRTLLDGNATLAEQYANSSFKLATNHQDPDARSVWVAQISIARWMQGRASEMEEYYHHARSEEPWRAVWAAVLAWMWTKQGRHGDAADALESIGPIVEIPRDRHWLLTMSTLAEVAATIGDTDRAVVLRDFLISYATRLVPIGLGVAVWGTVARPLGLLSRLLGKSDEAIAHFRQSVYVCTQAGALPWLVESQLDLAEALRGIGGSDPEAEAIVLARQALASASELGLTAFVPRANAILANLGVEPSAPHKDTQRLESKKAPRPSITVMGRFEVSGADGSIPHWTSRKARALLQLLVAARGDAVSRESVMDTLWSGEDPAVLSNRMSVAISTVRRALDPSRTHPPQHFLRADRNVLQLNRDRVDIDVESFLQAAAKVFAQPTTVQDETLASVIEQYSGDVFADEPYEEWTQHLRHEARNTVAALCRLKADSASSEDNPLLAAELHRRVLRVDPYDEHAHLGLIAALESLGVEGQARLAQEHYRAVISELAS